MTKMPVLFAGHGSPMNAIEDNQYTRNWKHIAQKIPTPKAIVAISAHWYTKGTYIMNEEQPKTIHDMYGFPQRLYEIFYRSPGAPKIASMAKQLISKETAFDNSWGIDHGTWSVLVHMYPNQNIPVFQISIDGYASPDVHYQMGKELAALRDEGILIFGSGNVVHNLRMVDWDLPGKGFDWAHQFDDYIYNSIVNYDHPKVIEFSKEPTAKLAVPTPDHFYPLLYTLGATTKDDQVTVFNRSGEMGSLTMTGYLWE